MSTVTLNLELNPEQTEALLAALISQKAIVNVSTTPSAATTAPITPAPQKAPVPANPIVAGSPSATIPTMAPVMTLAPNAPIATGVTPNIVLPSAVPTAPSHEYTLDDLAVAAQGLMDTGKMQELMNTLGKFKIQSMQQLPKDQYGAFATELRGLGAKI